MSHSDIAEKVKGEGRDKLGKRKLYFDMAQPKPAKKVFRKGRKPQEPKKRAK